jgi:hypothetical protein
VGAGPRSTSVDVGDKASRLVWEYVMSKADEFRRYAEEAMGWVKNCTDPNERRVLISLAQTWTEGGGS